MTKFRMAAGLVSASVVALAVACSSSSDNTATTDAGALPETGSGTDATSDVQNDTSTVTDASIDPNDVCAVQAAYDMRCTPDAGVSAACVQARRAQCPQSTMLDGKLIHDTTLHCASATSSCDSAAYKACSDAEISKATPTAAQASVRDHLCTRCGGGAAAVAQCKQEFFFDPEAGGPGVGITVYVSSDALAAKMDTTCAIPNLDGGNNDCQLDFYDCAGTVYNEAQLPTPAACIPPDAGP